MIPERPHCLQPDSCKVTPRGVHCRSCNGKIHVANMYAKPEHRQRLIEAGAARFRGNSELAKKAVNARIAKNYARLGLQDGEIEDYRAFRKQGFSSPEAASVIINSRR